jgi:hypothetical protein
MANTSFREAGTKRCGCGTWRRGKKCGGSRGTFIAGLERRGDARWQIRRFGKRRKRCVCGSWRRGKKCGGSRGTTEGLERRGDARWQIRRFGKRDKTVRLWELATGKEVRRFTGHEDCGQERRGDARWQIRRFGKRGQHGAFVVHRRFVDAGQVAAGHRTSKAQWQTVGRTRWLQASAAFPITQSRRVAASQTQDKQSGW